MKYLIRGTFREFLTRNKLHTLEPLFHAVVTQQGYGHIDEISALYGLIWNTPKLMCSMLGRMQGKATTGNPYVQKCEIMKGGLNI